MNNDMNNGMSNVNQSMNNNMNSMNNMNPGMNNNVNPMNNMNQGMNNNVNPMNNMNQGMNNNVNPMNNMNQGMNNNVNPMNNMNQGMNNNMNPNMGNQFNNMNSNNGMNNNFGGNPMNNPQQNNNGNNMSSRIKSIIGMVLTKQMKPIIIGAAGIILLIICYFLFIGGGKTLYCSKTTSLNILEEISFNYRGKKAVSGKGQFTIEKSKVDSYTFERYGKADLCKEIKTDISKEDITSCKQTTTNDRVMLITTFKIDPDEEQDAIEETKELYEEDGYSCSIK